MKSTKRKIYIMNLCKNCGNRCKSCYYVAGKNGICTGYYNKNIDSKRSVQVNSKKTK